MNPKLSEVADRYARTKKLLSDLESETGYLSLTTRTVNDLRHTLDHILRGIAHEQSGDNRQARYLYEGAVEHLREHELNSFENVAGMALRETRLRLEGAGFFSDAAQALGLQEEATKSYSLGRQLRTEDSEASLAHFRKAAGLSLAARRQIKPAPPWRRFLLWWTVLLGLATLVNIVLGLLQLFT